MALAISLAGCEQRARLPPFAGALLAVAEPTSLESKATPEALSSIAALVDQRLRGGVAPVQALNDVVFGALGFAREVDDGDRRFMRLPSVLSSRRGSCLGLGALYLALGDHLGRAHGFTVDGILVPGHFFVRVTDRDGPRDVELLRRGERMPESWYREKYGIPDPTPSAYLRALRPPEVLAVFDYNLGNDHRRQGRLSSAATSYERAVKAFPQLAEAHASLGLVRHLTGALADAERAYQAALAANPRLPGLAQNLAVVREELGRQRPTAPGPGAPSPAPP